MVVEVVLGQLNASTKLPFVARMSVPGGRPRALAGRPAASAQDEWDAGHIPGSVHQPYHDIDDIPDGIDPGRPVAGTCGSGQRAAVAASLLQRFGAEHVIHVVRVARPKWGRICHWLERSEAHTSTSA